MNSKRAFERNLKDLGIADKIAWVMGGACGIEPATVRLLLNGGVTVALSDLHQDALDDAAGSWPS